MDRKRPSSTQETGNSSFSSSAPPALPLAKWQSSNDDSWSPQRPSKRPRSAVPNSLRIPANVYEDAKDIAKFVNRPETHLSPVGPYYPTQRSLKNQTSSSRQDSPFMYTTPLSQSPATPTTADLTSAPTLTSTSMSRDGGSFASSNVGAMEMMRLGSGLSSMERSFDASPYQSSTSLTPTNDFKPSATEKDTSYLFRHMDGTMDSASTTQLHTPAMAIPSSVVVQDMNMQRTVSNNTHSSHPPQSSRCIAPKATEGVPMSRESSSASSMSSSSSTSGHSMKRIVSADGLEKDVYEIPRIRREVQTSEKIRCKLCNDRPDGYRGEHEIRRHVSRAHTPRRVAFVCIDISSDNKFLANCKACRNQKKYNADYNAAAHLRRAHWNPKKDRKAKGSEAGEKREGYSGGTEPPMEELRGWMRQIEIDEADNELPPKTSPVDDGSRQSFMPAPPSIATNDILNGSVSAPSDFGAYINSVSAPIAMPANNNNNNNHGHASRASCSSLLDDALDLSLASSLHANNAENFLDLSLDTSRLSADASELVFPFSPSLNVQSVFEDLNQTDFSF